MAKHTCLITRDELDEKTRLEHTIPRAMGGRYRSRIVSSTRFNNEASRFDDALATPYLLFLSNLAPLMAKEHEPKSIDTSIEGAPGHYILQPGGILDLKGGRVDDRDPNTGLPKAISHSSPEALHRWAQQMGWIDGEYQEGRELSAAPGVEAQFLLPVLDPKFEVGALRSSLLTFDHALAERGQDRFTRDAALADTRDFLAGAVLTPEADYASELSSLSLGICSKDLEVVGELRERIVDVPRTQFEHILVASCNADVRTVDILWAVAGIDVVRFRVSRKWNGPDRTYVIGCGITRDTSTFGPLVLKRHTPIAPPTNQKSCDPSTTTPAQMQDIAASIGERRRAAIREALDLVERTADEHVIDSILEVTKHLSEDGAHLRDGLVVRLESFFRDRMAQGAIEALVDSEVSALPEGLRDMQVATDKDRPSRNELNCWLETYRRALAEATQQVGLPGVLAGRGITASEV